MNPNFGYAKQFTVKDVSQNFIDYLRASALVIEARAVLWCAAGCACLLWSHWSGGGHVVVCCCVVPVLHCVTQAVVLLVIAARPLAFICKILSCNHDDALHVDAAWVSILASVSIAQRRRCGASRATARGPAPWAARRAPCPCMKWTRPGWMRWCVASVSSRTCDSPCTAVRDGLAGRAAVDAGRDRAAAAGDPAAAGGEV